MPTIDCPWCQAASQLPFPLPDQPEASFSCPECGTSIDWAEEPVALDLAA